MELIYQVYKGDNGVLLLMSADGKPVKAGTAGEVSQHVVTAHTKPRSIFDAPTNIPVNKQTPAEPPVVPRPVSGAAG